MLSMMFVFSNVVGYVWLSYVCIRFPMGSCRIPIRFLYDSSKVLPLCSMFVSDMHMCSLYFHMFMLSGVFYDFLLDPVGFLYDSYMIVRCASYVLSMCYAQVLKCINSGLICLEPTYPRSSLRPTCTIPKLGSWCVNTNSNQKYGLLLGRMRQ